MKKIRNILNILVFTIIIFSLGIILILKNDNEISLSERRNLAQMPKFTLSNVMSGEFSKSFEEYMLDQFPLRDEFRAVNYTFRTDMMQQSDVNELYVYNGGVYKILYPLDEKQVRFASDKINEIQSKYLTSDTNVYVSIIPDKTYYNDNENTLKLSHETLVEQLVFGLENANYIELKDCLNIDEYYSTDIHWKQECLFACANKLLYAMGKNNFVSEENYEVKTYDNFIGGYSAQIGLNKSERLSYLENDTLRNCIVYDIAEDKEISIYNEDALSKLDSYDVFLYGAKPLISIINPSSASADRLIIFRDSFASSITPLLIDNYNEIILVDLRYISTDMLSKYIDFNNCDVLFLYSASVINGASILK